MPCLSRVTALVIIAGGLIAGAASNAGCANTPAVPGEILQPEIESVEVAGAPELDTESVTDALANHSPLGIFDTDHGRLERLALEADRRRIEAFLREQGYFAAEVEEAEITPASEGRVALLFRVRLGPASRVRSIAVAGAPAEPGVDRAALTALLGIIEGAAFRYADYEAAKERIREHLFNAGYAHAQVSGEVEVARASSEAAIVLYVHAGPPVTFGPAVLTGSTALPARSLESRIAWKEGDRFDPQRLQITRRRIEELSLAGSVSFDLAGPDDAPIAPVRVGVEDALRNELRLGGGFSFIGFNNYELRGVAVYARKFFFDPLYTFRSEVRPGASYDLTGKIFAPKIQASAEIIRDDFFVPRLSMTTGASFSAVQYELYSTLGPSAHLTFTRPFLDDHLFLGLRAEIDHLELDSDLADSDLGRFGGYDPQRFVFLSPSISYDARDDLLSPRTGFLLRFQMEVGRTLGVNASWIKVEPEARGYVPLFTDRLILAARIHYGTALSASGPLTLARRYFAGGSESQRGFSRRLLAPDAINSKGDRGPMGGESLFESSAELRLELFRLFGSWLGLVAFVDAADVTLEPKDLDLLDLHVAAGPGLRYHTPIGPIRVDVGIRLNRRAGHEPQPGSNWAFHFSLGEAF